MASQHDALIRLLDAIGAMRAAGFTRDDITELVTAAFQHLEGDHVRPHAFGPLHPLQHADCRVVGLPMVHPRPGTVPTVRKALVILRSSHLI